jgi:RNA polymerase sigma factor (TIGR02999 family)
MYSPSEITELLICWCEGDQAALEKLAPLVEDKLHEIAHRYMSREKLGHFLQITALVNEAFLRLIDQKPGAVAESGEFLRIAAQIMRRILLNHARDQKRVKRGGGALDMSLSEAEAVSVERSAELIALDEALNRLALIDERKSRIVELRYFGGLSVKETAEALQVSLITVARDWNLAKAWLAREISHGV